MLSNLATALAPTFAIALVSRVFAGLGAAMYAPTATGTGASIVAPAHRGQAIARLAPLKESRVGWTLLTTFLGMAGNFLVYIYFAAVFDRVLLVMLLVLNTAATYLGVTTAWSARSASTSSGRTG